MTVLVTGASGLLGRAVATLLVDGGHTVRTFQRRPSSVAGAADVAGSLTETVDVRRAVQGVDAVIHLAAKVSVSGPTAEFEAVNVEGTRRLLAEAHDAGARAFVFVSSPSVAHAGFSIVGAGAEPASPSHARGNYARTKAAAELLALAADSGNFRVSAVRPHIVWGPGDTQLVGRVLQRAKAGRLPLLGGGTALVDTTYVDNAASAIVAALTRIEYVGGQAVVVSNGEPRPIGELLAAICRAGGVREPRRSVPASVGRMGGNLAENLWRLAAPDREPPMTRFLAEQLSTAHWFDQRRTQALLDWAPEVSLDEGFAQLAGHYGGSTA
ncbi:NAD-dependent epimerase/dehydratase family protein [Arthrobacter sp. H5]|uniref:NAD-dependent epimerase/dehydratase family protein n=1 Tax=Arthrobacter sp. H5 TaxID=1267973 RepID=UPI000486F98A|nr:NAD-dependent epimerase/dehydratase family protein [Arthrobacter sp. H5]